MLPASLPQKKRALKNFAKFTGQNLCWSLFFTKVAGLTPVTLLKRKLQHGCYPMNFSKFLRTLFYRTSPAAASIGQRLVLHFDTSHSGRTVYFSGENILPEPQFIIIPLLPILR